MIYIAGAVKLAYQICEKKYSVYFHICWIFHFFVTSAIKMAYLFIWSGIDVWKHSSPSD